MTVNIYAMTDTWNAGGTTFDSISMDVSNGAGGAPVGAAASRVINLKSNGTSIFSVSIAGAIAAGVLALSTAGAASVPVITCTGAVYTAGTATTAKAMFLLEPSGTTSTNWNTAGTFVGVNAASGFTGDLFNFQVNNLAILTLSAGGNLIRGGFGGLNFNTSGNVTIGQPSSRNEFFVSAGSTRATFSSDTIVGFTDTSGSPGANTIDVIFRRDAAAMLGFRDGTNAQQIAVYNTSSSSNANYERLTSRWSSNVAYLNCQAAGTGTVRLFVPVTGATTVASLPSASTAGAGARSQVTDATVATFGTAPTGGGSVKVPVYSDGTNWLMG